jgi:hypothetical protein
VFGAVLLLLFPCLLQCAYERVLLEYSWGAVNLTLGMRGERVEAFSRALVHTVGPKRGGSRHVDEEDEPDQGGGKDGRKGSWVSNTDDWAAWLGVSTLLGFGRTLEVTSHRIRILADAGFTQTTYWKDSLTEADSGPIRWVDMCCGLAPCDGWRRVKDDDQTPLSLNFGWVRAEEITNALPGTKLKISERFVFARETTNEIISVMDPVIGNFCHNLWSPDPVGESR